MNDMFFTYQSRAKFLYEREEEIKEQTEGAKDPDLSSDSQPSQPSDRILFHLQEEFRDQRQELPKRDEAVRGYTEAVKSAWPGLYQDGAVKMRG